MEVVKYLISEHGLDIHAKNGQALVNAASVGSFNVIKYLVAHGANIHTQNDQALKDAANYGYLEVVKYFILEHNCDIKIALGNTKKDKVIDWCKSYMESKGLNDKLEIDLEENSDKIIIKVNKAKI